MKKLITLILVSIIASFPLLVSAKNTYRPSSSHNYITGKKGGCYYINRNGNKTYVDRDLCR